MILIVEGVNNTGKSTLINFLESSLGYHSINDDTNKEYSHDKHAFGIHSKAVLLAYTNILMKCPDSFNVIFDRFHLSEFVYGMIERGYYSSWVFDIDDQLFKMGAKLLYMEDDLESVNERAGRDLKMHQELFETVYNQSMLDKMRYNLKNPVSEVLGWIQDEKQQQHRSSVSLIK